MALQLSLNVTHRQGRNVGQASVKCCDVLTENLAQGVMQCDACYTNYPVTAIHEMISEAQRQLDELRSALEVK